ncbi:hypothetical protein V6N13_139310 [Hibiscus sabdariffa]|uniref:Uncharacterized protein n=1 Tax=Hibiscus sabdariffa TaxID=183260 RepID=A0ABR2C8I0_9ROSI
MKTELFIILILAPGGRCGPHDLISSSELRFEFSFTYTRNSSEFKLLGPDELIPGLINVVPPNVLPWAWFDKDSGYPLYMMMAQRFKTAKGIMVNTFEELEPYAINGFSNDASAIRFTVRPVLDISCKPHPDLDLAQHEN